MPSEKKVVCYLDELVEPFYKTTSDDINSLSNGQLCWAPVSYLESQVSAWRPDLIENKETDYATADYFTYVENPQDVFSHKKPLMEPQKRTSEEEFLYANAKMRPIILINKVSLDDAIKEVRYGHKFENNIWIAVPIYSIEDPITQKIKFENKTIENTRLLKYQNLFFLPSYPSSKIRESLCRIDYVFSIRRTLLKPMSVKLTEPPLNIIQELLTSIITGKIKPDGMVSTCSSMLIQ